MSAMHQGSVWDMTTNPRGLQPLDLGPSGKQLAENLKRLRKTRSVSLRELSQQLQGVKLSADAINKIEKQQRRAHTDELVALAVALQVNVSALLLPPTDEDSVTTEVTGAGVVSARAAWDWADGDRLLTFSPVPDELTQQHQFQVYARPPIRRMLRAGLSEMGRDTFQGIPDSEFRRLLQALLDAGQKDSAEHVQVRPPDDQENNET